MNANAFPQPRPRAATAVDYQELFTELSTAYLVVSTALVLVDVNDAYLALTGRGRAELMGRPLFEAFPPTPESLTEDGENPIEDSFRRVSDTGMAEILPLQKFDIHNPATGDIEVRYWSLVHSALTDVNGRPRLLLQRVEDVTEFVRYHRRADDPEGDAGVVGQLEATSAELYTRLQELAAAKAGEVAALSALRASEQQARAVMDTAVDAIILIDRTGVIAEVNRSAQRMFRNTKPRMVGSNAALLLAGDQWTELLTPPENTDTARSHRASELEGCRSDGTRFAAEIAVSHLGTASDLLTLVIRDISERKVLQAQLAHRALHDPLTGLANRALLMDRLAHAVTRLRRHPGTLAVLFLDLDGFKLVNDTHGHHTGDRLLTLVADRLRATVRSEDLVARLGGDEFVVLCEETASPQAARVVADRIVTVLTEPVVIGELRLRCGVSVGVVTDDGHRTADELLSAADHAMYAAKRQGGGWTDTV